MRKVVLKVPPAAVARPELESSIEARVLQRRMKPPWAVLIGHLPAMMPRTEQEVVLVAAGHGRGAREMRAEAVDGRRKGGKVLEKRRVAPRPSRVLRERERRRPRKQALPRRTMAKEAMEVMARNLVVVAASAE